MSKIKLNKKGVLGLLTVGSLTLAIPIGSHLLRKNETTNIETGYENINPILNFNVDDNDFVILDIGDHNSVKTHFQNKKMTYCNQNNLSLGIVISSDAKTLVEIYDDVEYVKKNIQDYQVNLPVYLNIDEIITNDKLNVDMKSTLIKTFIEKCRANNIYVGISGTDTNLCRVKKYCDIPSCDAYLIMDQKEIKYDGTYNIYKDLENNIIKKSDLKESVSRKNLNNKTNFVQDGFYKMKKQDDITDIALQYDLSVNELLEFNGLSKKELTEGTILRIPSITIRNVVGSGTYKKAKTPLRGCDLSYAQGSDINWDALEENFEFIILKCSQGIKMDSSFEENAKNCNLNGIPIGAYCYNNYTKKNCSNMDEFRKNQEAQADFVLSLVKNHDITYPVYFDIEAPNGKELKEQLSKEQVEIMLDIWYRKMNLSGYTPGLYCNKSGFEYLQSCVNYDLTEKLEVWLAGGNQYSAKKKDIELEDVKPSSLLSENNNIPMAQSTDSAINGGAGNSKGHLDINYSLIDYSKEITTLKDPEETFAIKEFNRYDQELIFGSSIATVAGLASILGINRIKKKTKRR